MKYKIIFLLIILLSCFLRFINLGKLPNSFTPDELAQGYTAYSILKTGKDEWGNSNLLNLRSFGDYKPPLQTLLMIPSISIFGLTPFAVRFPNAIFSVLTVVFTYFLTIQVLKDKKIALLSALFICLSPWALPMSRIALEANLVIFIITFATFLFLYSYQKKNLILFFISLIFFGVSLFTYHSAKIFTPLLLIGLIIFQKIYKNKLFLISLCLIFSLFLIFQKISTNTIKSSRTNNIAIFNPTDNWKGVSNNQFEMTQNGLPYSIVKLFYNKVVYLGEIFTQSYFSYFSPQFLITHGAGETTYGMLPGFGVLGIIPTFGVICLLFFILKNKFKQHQESLIFIFFAVLIPPLIASLAKGQYSANRVSLMMPFIQIIAAAGLVFLVENIPIKFKKISIFLLSSIFLFTSFIFSQRYFFQSNQILAKGMLYGHQQAIAFVKNNPQIDTVIYSRKLSEPQAYVSFFEKINPSITQTESTNWLKYESENLPFLDMLGEYNLGKYTFREINPPSDSKIPNAILIGRPEEFRDLKPTYIIYYPQIIEPPEAIYIYQSQL